MNPSSIKAARGMEEQVSRTLLGAAVFIFLTHPHPIPRQELTNPLRPGQLCLAVKNFGGQEEGVRDSLVAGSFVYVDTQGGLSWWVDGLSTSHVTYVIFFQSSSTV